MRWIDKLEFKYGHWGIPNLILFITADRAITYFLGFSNPDFVNVILLDPAAVWRGEWWRLFTFVLTPPPAGGSGLVAFIDLYFMLWSGRMVEQNWGTFRFSLFYIMGAAATALVAFLIVPGPTAPYYLNMSIFLAFATLFPDLTVLLMFIIPVKVKYLGWISVAFLTYAFWTTGVAGKLAILVALSNYVVFFWRDINEWISSRFRRSSYRSSAPTPLPPSVLGTPEIPPPPPTHKCATCGLTERDKPDMDFRWCSCKKCGDGREFCMEHLKEHRSTK